MKSFGLILDPIEIEKDYVFGGFGALDGEILQPTGQWHDHLPEGEKQRNFGFDPQACVSFGTLSACEILIRRIYGEVDNFSDRFLATISGTTPQGNSPQKVAEALRKQGVIREVGWPVTRDLTSWEKFYADIPNDVKILAQEFPTKFDFKHEYVPTDPASLKKALTRGPLGIAVSAWKKDPITGLHISDFPNNHFVVLIGYRDGEYWEVFDSYDGSGGYVKRLAWNHTISQAKRYRLLIKVDRQSPKWWEFIVGLIKLAFGITAPTPQPTPAPKPVHPNYKAELLQDMCLAIKHHEGWFEGSRSQRNRNPGNVKYSPVGYLLKYGIVKKDPQGFAVFENYALGYMYLQNFILEKARQNPTWNLYRFFSLYAPKEDNNDSRRYAEVVAKVMNVSPETWPIRNLL